MRTVWSKALGAAVALCLALVTPAAAVDGEILIDQAQVKEGGITRGDAPGFPATLNRPGRYKLSGNLLVPAGVNAIEVVAADVTIDLNGFTIASDPPGAAGSGVVASSGGLLRVTNGTVTGFSGAGVTKFSGRAVIENMRILSNGRNLDLSAESQVRNSTIANGGGSGVEPGIRCFARCLIEQNIITGHTGSGIKTEAGGTVVLGNVITGNGFDGIQSSEHKSGYGDNILVDNGPGGQVSGLVSPLHPNACEPACP